MPLSCAREALCYLQSPSHEEGPFGGACRHLQGFWNLMWFSCWLEGAPVTVLCVPQSGCGTIIFYPLGKKLPLSAFVLKMGTESSPVRGALWSLCIHLPSSYVRSTCLEPWDEAANVPPWGLRSGLSSALPGSGLGLTHHSLWRPGSHTLLAGEPAVSCSFQVSPHLVK